MIQPLAVDFGDHRAPQKGNGDDESLSPVVAKYDTFDISKRPAADFNFLAVREYRNGFHRLGNSRHRLERMHLSRVNRFRHGSITKNMNDARTCEYRQRCAVVELSEHIAGK